MLKKVWVLSPEERAHRQVVRTRRQIVDHRSDVMRQIKSLLLFHSIEVPFSSRQQWTGPFVKWLHEVDLGNEYLNRALKALVELFDYQIRSLKHTGIRRPTSRSWILGQEKTIL